MQNEHFSHFRSKISQNNFGHKSQDIPVGIGLMLAVTLYQTQTHLNLTSKDGLLPDFG